MLGVVGMNKYQQQTLDALIGYLQYSPIKDFDFILQQLLKIKNDSRTYWQV